MSPVGGLPVSDQQTRPDEDTRAPAKKHDRKTLMVAIAFGVALVLLIVLNMN
jgi:hypothetical protein